MEKIKAILSKDFDEDSWNTVERYISSITSREDALEYLEEMLDINNDEHTDAIDAFLNTLPDSKANDNLMAYNKFGPPRQGEDSGNLKKGKKKSKQQLGMEKYNLMFPEKSALPEKDIPAPLVPAGRDPPDGKSARRKGRAKYVPLFSGDAAAKAVMLPGRHQCDCCATKHRLVNNCLGCGRIVCAQEGSGPCMTCGDLVCSREEREILNRGSKKSEQLRAQLLKQGVPNEGPQLDKAEEDLKKAEEYKERLLDFDRTSARRTRVIDDEMDYFQTDSTTWLTPAEREKLRIREEELRSIRHANKRTVRLSLDFAGRSVVLKEDTERTEERQATEALYGGSDDLIEGIHGAERKDRQSAPAAMQSDGKAVSHSVDPSITREPPMFVPSHRAPSRPRQRADSQAADVRRQALRNQDAELRELRDDGQCLSMHQPWASLLVRGIKTDEGRTWYSPHRGRLWIAATSKPASPEEIEEHQRVYRALGVPAEAFPKSYPSGCLLGCVDVIECLPQADYKKAYPDGESASPFVFVCCNPRELLVKFPISGKHKIYHLDPHVHEAARKGIERATDFRTHA